MSLFCNIWNSQFHSAFQLISAKSMQALWVMIRPFTHPSTCFLLPASATVSIWLLVLNITVIQLSKRLPTNLKLNIPQIDLILKKPVCHYYHPLEEQEIIMLTTVSSFLFSMQEIFSRFEQFLFLESWQPNVCLLALVKCHFKYQQISTTPFQLLAFSRPTLH